MYANILVPVVVDEEAKTQTAIEAATAMANPGARITLLHVIETIPVYVSDYVPADYMITARESVAKRLEDLAADIPNGHAAIADGRAGPRITRWAEENGIDCIVIASHQPALSDILLGSVAGHVVRHAKSAVHVVR